MFERAEAVGKFVRRSFQERKGEISAAHNFGHVGRVATYAPQIVLALGGTEREAELAKAAAFLHDLYRSPTEMVEDEFYSAQQAKPFLNKLEKFSDFEVKTILQAMQTHKVSKTLLKSKGRHSAPFTGVNLIRFAVFAADKLEANGPYVMARRSQFVGGERYHEGDLKMLRERVEKEDSVLAGKITPVVVVLLESYIRLGKKNNPEIYPRWFRPVVDGLFEKQTDFYHALLKAQGMHEADVAVLLKKLKFPGIKPEEIDDWESRRSNSDSAVDAVGKDAAQSALEVVNHFSAPKFMKMNTAGAIERFKPKLSHSQVWHEEMREYLQGGVERLINALGKNRRKIL